MIRYQLNPVQVGAACLSQKQIRRLVPPSGAANFLNAKEVCVRLTAKFSLELIK